ncbi:MAG: D-hexose-6-phosphate mutarotase [Hyphomicrobiaceae bacterium]
MGNIDRLGKEFGIEGKVTFEKSALGGPVVRLQHGTSEALVALHGAQVLNWLVDGRGLLWLSSAARIRPGKGIRGGIPVCWPWFGDHPTDGSKPAHGFVRHREWHVLATGAGAGGTTITLTTSVTDRDRALWPHQATAKVIVTLSDTLSIALETANTGDASFRLTEALHTYFRVHDISSARVTGLEGCNYLDKLEGFARKQQSGAIDIAAELDRIYLGNTAGITLADAGAGHRIAITSEGSRSAVVWNPWTDKTARLGDMGAPDAFRQMLCIETANAGDDIVTLAHGARHRMAVTYRYLAGV